MLQGQVEESSGTRSKLTERGETNRSGDASARRDVRKALPGGQCRRRKKTRKKKQDRAASFDRTVPLSGRSYGDWGMCIVILTRNKLD